MAIDVTPLSVERVRAVGALVRTIHDASEQVPVADGWPVLLPALHADLMCHNDLVPWNLVVDGDRLVFIDWDGAGPSSRAWDLAYAAIAFARLVPKTDVKKCITRLAALLDGYDAGADLRGDLPDLLVERSRAMYELLRTSHAPGPEPWGSMYVDGHGEHLGRNERIHPPPSNHLARRHRPLTSTPTSVRRLPDLPPCGRARYARFVWPSFDDRG